MGSLLIVCRDRRIRCGPLARRATISRSCSGGEPLLPLRPRGAAAKAGLRFFVDRTRRPALKPAPAKSAADGMANHKSAEKRIRQTEKRTAINRSRMSRVRTFVKKVETAISTGDKATAQAALRLAQPELHRAITKTLTAPLTISSVVA